MKTSVLPLARVQWERGLGGEGKLHTPPFIKNLPLEGGDLGVREAFLLGGLRLGKLSAGFQRQVDSKMAANAGITAECNIAAKQQRQTLANC